MLEILNEQFTKEHKKRTIYNSIYWMENTLVKNGVFRLPSKRDVYTYIQIKDKKYCSVICIDNWSK